MKKDGMPPLVSPSVSVITICRNERANIRRTAESVVGQTWPALEWIVIDGESTDGTLQELDAFKGRIARLVSARDGGVYAAQNRGARLAQGDFLIFLNGGDSFASPDAIESLASLSDSCDLVYGDLVAVDPEGAERLLRAPDRPCLSYMLHSTIWHPTALIRAELFRVFGPYDESFRIAADYDFFLRILTHGRARAKHCRKPIARFDLGGLSSRPENQATLANERRRAQEACLSPLVLEHLESVVPGGLPWAGAKLVKNCLIKALSLSPAPVQRAAAEIRARARRH